MLKPNLIICLIQEDYDAAKPDGEMDEARAVKRGDPADYDWPDPRSILPWITSDHKALFYELFFLGEWCWRRDSNSQPPDYKSGALPIEPRQQ